MDGDLRNTALHNTDTPRTQGLVVGNPPPPFLRKGPICYDNGMA